MSASLPILQRPNSCSSCSLCETGRGFALDVGDPSTARIAIMLETPAAEEVNFSVIPPPAHLGTRQVLGTVREAQEEALRRSAAFPDIPGPLRSRGVPVVGRTGAVLNRLLKQAGIVREHCFIGNSIRCFPPKSAKGDNYPTGNEKNIAQAACRQYDRLGDGLGKFAPDVIVVTLHPASLFKEGASSGEPLILADLEKVACFAKQGLRVLLLMGGHACETFLGFANNVSRWRGHYEWTSKEFYNWYENRIGKLNAKAEKARRAAMPKVPKEKKKTKAEVAREFLAESIFNAVDDEIERQGMPRFGLAVKNSLMREILAKLTPPKKERKAKVVQEKENENGIPTDVINDPA